MTLKDRMVLTARKITVEPAVLLLTAGTVPAALVAVPRYIEERLAQDRNFSLIKDDDINGTCSDQNITSNPDYAIQQEIAADVAFWVMLNTMFMYIPALFTVPFLGALSDRLQLGRKVPLLVPSVGMALSLFVNGLGVAFRWPIPWFCIAGLFTGLGGGYAFFVTGCSAYLSDVSSGKSRLLRIAIARAVFEGVAGLAQIPAVYIIEEFSIQTLVWVSFGLCILAILYVLSPCLPTPTTKASTPNKITLNTLAQDVKGVFAVNTEKRRARLVIFLLIYFVTDLIQLSQGATTVFIVYGLGPPLCWSTATAGTYAFTLFVCGAIGGLVFGRLFAICLDYFWILQIAYVFGLVSYMISAFALTTLVFTMGAVLSSLRAMDSPVLEVMLSTLVEPNERGTVFALAASMQCLANALSPVIFNPIYSATVDTQPNAVFFVMSSGFILLFLLSWTWLGFTKMATLRKYTPLQKDAE